MKPFSIMIIDDCEDDRYLLKRTLKKTKHTGEIFESENGKKAIDFLSNQIENQAKYPNSFPPLLIFLDINMPIMNGFEFLENLDILRKSHTNLKSVVLAMITSSERKEDLQKSKGYDFVRGFITKDLISPEKLTLLFKDAIPHIFNQQG